MRKTEEQLHESLREDRTEEVLDILRDFALHWFVFGLIVGAVVAFLINWVI